MRERTFVSVIFIGKIFPNVIIIVLFCKEWEKCGSNILSNLMGTTKGLKINL
jgi:hypothetical protein